MTDPNSCVRWLKDAKRIPNQIPGLPSKYLELEILTAYTIADCIEDLQKTIKNQQHQLALLNAKLKEK